MPLITYRVVGIWKRGVESNAICPSCRSNHKSPEISNGFVTGQGCSVELFRRNASALEPELEKVSRYPFILLIDWILSITQTRDQDTLR